jgi:hypothetical protein
MTHNSDLASFSISGFQRRKAPPKPAFTVRALRARTVNAKGARSEITFPQYLPTLALTGFHDTISFMQSSRLSVQPPRVISAP